MKRKFLSALMIILLPGFFVCGGGGGGGGGSSEEQPTLGIHTSATGKQTISVDGLQFKDLNGSGSLDDYEDWRLSAAERAADLVTRMSTAEKIGLMLHVTTTDIPSSSSASVSTALQTLINSGNVRFGLTGAHTSALTPRANWANNVQELCEASSLGIPFILSMEPCHSSGNGRTLAKGYSQWPQELGLASAGSTTVVENFGKYANQEYRAIGVRMALSPSADLLTDPRWFNGQFTFGEDSQTVAGMIEAYIKGFQGTSIGTTSVACIVKYFPGAGPSADGWDGRLAKGQYLTYPGDNIDAHLAVFERAFEAGVAGVMPAYGIPETGSWSGLGGLLNGSTIEQAGAAFNNALITGVLRDHYDFTGLVLSAWGVIGDAGVSPFGAPWGVEALDKAHRAAKAVNAGVEQFGGLDDSTPISSALSAGLITGAQIDAAAEKALLLMFTLGIFENPYVDASKAPSLCNTDNAYQAGLDALNRSMVLILNANKPSGWLNGTGDGTQTGDPGNAGNGSGRVLPAPPGQVYVTPGCNFYVAGSFSIDYVNSVSAGYGTLTNFASSVESPVESGIVYDTLDAASKMAYSDYVFIRLGSPFSADADSGSFNYSEESLEYASNDNAAVLDDVRAASNAIDTYGTQCQIIVGIDAGRLPVVSEIMAIPHVSGIYVSWGVTDKVFLDVAFGIVKGEGTLPAGLPRADSVVQDQSQQKEDLPDDGQHATFVRGWGYTTAPFSN
ncbi:MAG: glycoside hydrolase family 3 protein [Spirochaetes bacterium]|nr:MAG: glycoside hydrolase family 3 protein [Spirochaetota bacterium]